MKCPKCHKRFKGNFCPYCGAPNETPPLKVRFRDDTKELLDVFRSHKLSLLAAGLLGILILLAGLVIGNSLGRSSLKNDLAQSEANLTRLDSDYAKLLDENASLEQKLKEAEEKLTEADNTLQLYTAPEHDTAEPESEGDLTEDVQTLDEAIAESESGQDILSLPADLMVIPAFKESASVPLHNNVPFFTDSDLAGFSGIRYSELDELGRTGAAAALIGPETLTSKTSGLLSGITPSGFMVLENDSVKGRIVFRRCHLIDWRLGGGYTEPLNVLTGTRYFDTEAIAPYEDQILSYVESSNCHVLYRVTPLYNGGSLVADGVMLEASSVEDNGDAVNFCVFCYNVQPGVELPDSSAGLE